MSGGISVSLHGAVQEVVGDKELLSLTGSASILNFYGYKILIDLGLFQGGEGAELFNRENIDFINNLDAVFVTHSHIDHIGRIPLLYKSGFRKKIYMTKESKAITEKMLIDSLNIQKQDQKVKKKRNKGLISRLEKALKFKKELDEIGGTRKLQTQEERDLAELNKYLEYFSINDEKDIQRINAKLLFNEDDIKGIMGLIKVAEYGDEIKLDNQRVLVRNENREDYGILEKLPLELFKKQKEKSKLEYLIEKLERAYSSKYVSIEELKEKLASNNSNFKSELYRLESRFSKFEEDVKEEEKKINESNEIEEKSLMSDEEKVKKEKEKLLEQEQKLNKRLEKIRRLEIALLHLEAKIEKSGDGCNEEKMILAKMRLYIIYFRLKSRNTDLENANHEEKLLDIQKDLSKFESTAEVDKKKEKKKNKTSLDDRLKFDDKKLEELKEIEQKLLPLEELINKDFEGDCKEKLLLNRLKLRLSALREKYINYVVDKKSEKRYLREKWIVSLINDVKNSLIESNIDFKHVNESLKKELEIAFNFCHNIYPSFIKGKKGANVSVVEEYDKDYTRYKKMLEFYGIRKQKNIELLHDINEAYVKDILNLSPEELIQKGREYILGDLTKVIKTYGLELELSPEDVNLAQKSIKVLNRESATRNDINVVFSDVAHLVGSASVTLTRNHIKKQVEDILGTTSVCFSGDMGRMHNNRLGRPELPPRKLDYLQMESTYGGKKFFHHEKDEILKDIMELINNHKDYDIKELVSLLKEITDGKTKLSDEELEKEVVDIIKTLSGESQQDNKDRIYNDILNVKNHRNREESVKELLDSIIDSQGNVLISVFSQQRAQEILLTIAEFLKDGGDLSDCEILVDGNLTREVTNVYTSGVNEKNYLFKLLTKEGQIETFGKEIFRFLDRDEFESIYTQGLIKTDRTDSELLSNSLQEKLFGEVRYVYLNENLWKDVSENKQINRDDVFGILIDKLQEKLFGEVVCKKLNNREWKKISSDEVETNEIFYGRFTDDLQREVFGRVIFKQFDTKKKIILSSSGMMDGGAIMNHLPFVLLDEKATILAPGYLSSGTLGREIVFGKNIFVTINGIKYEKKCNKKYIDGFSSHIGHDEILEYLEETINSGLFNEGATIALSHGNIGGQEDLKIDIDRLLEECGRTDIKVTIPGLFEEYDIVNKSNNGKVKKQDDNRDNIEANDDESVSDLNLPMEKPVVPRLVNDLEKKEEKEEEYEATQVVREERKKVSKNINRLKTRKQEYLRKRNKIASDYLSVLLNNGHAKKVNATLSRIKRLSSVQRVQFYDDIITKLGVNDSLSNHISKLGENKTELLKHFDYVIDFFKTNKKIISENVGNLRIKIQLLKSEIDSLQSELDDLENTQLKNNVLEIENKLKKINSTSALIKKNEEEILRVNNSLQSLLENELVNSKKVNSLNNELSELSKKQTELWNELYKELGISNEGEIEFSNEKVSLIKAKIYKQLSDLKLSLPKLGVDEKKNIKSLRRQIKIKKSELDKSEKHVKVLKKKVIENVNYLKNSLKNILPESHYERYCGIIDDFSIGYTNELEESLLNLFNEVKISFDREIERAKKKINSYVALKYKKGDKSFRGRNLHRDLLDTKLYDDIESLKIELSKISRELSKLNKTQGVDDIEKKKSELESRVENLTNKIKENKDRGVYQFNKKVDLNLEKLERLMNGKLFSQKELSEINDFLSIIRGVDTTKKAKLQAKNDLISYFKRKSNENRDVGRNESFNAKTLESEILIFLSTVFEPDDYELVKQDFNIYEFLKLKMTLREYILKKCSFIKIKGLDAKLAIFDGTVDKLDKLLNDLDYIKEKVDKNDDVGDIKYMNEVVDKARSDVEILLGEFKNVSNVNKLRTLSVEIEGVRKDVEKLINVD